MSGRLAYSHRQIIREKFDGRLLASSRRHVSQCCSLKSNATQLWERACSRGSSERRIYSVNTRHRLRPSRASPPTRTAQFMWEPGLPAMASPRFACQTALPESRASPLPQERRNFCGSRACPRWPRRGLPARPRCLNREQAHRVRNRLSEQHCGMYRLSPAHYAKRRRSAVLRDLWRVSALARSSFYATAEPVQGARRTPLPALPCHCSRIACRRETHHHR